MIDFFQVKWKFEDIYYDVVVNFYMLILVVGDMFGDVIIWNVMKGEFKLMFFGNGWLV